MLNLNKLNKQQKEAVTYGEGPLMVIAGPGSGKTYTIISRINYLIQVKQIPADKILVITFTKDAAKEMKTRFANDRSNANLPVHFGTFHSVSYGMLLKSGIIKENLFLTNSQKKKIIQKICNQKNIPGHDLYIPLDNTGKQDLDGILCAISIYKNTLSSAKATALLTDHWRENFNWLFQQYEVMRKYVGKYDFDDLIWDCLKELQTNKLFQNRWRNQFLHILIDEFQDINPIQYSWLKELVHEKQSIFAVGDDDQSIYGFRGSEPNCMKAYLQDFNSECIILSRNYRSCKQIVAIGNQVIEANENRIAKEMTAAYEGEGTVVKRGFETGEEQFAYILNLLSENRDITIAILFRTNIQMNRFAFRLRQKEINFRMNGKAIKLKDHFIVEDLLTYMKLSHDTYDRDLLMKIVHKPNRRIPREFFAHIDLPRLDETDRYSEELNQMMIQLNFLKSMTPFAGIQYILKGIGYEKYLKQRAGNHKDKLAEWYEILDFLKYLSLGCKRTSQWIHKVYEFDDLNNTVKGPINNSLRLMTMHGAKGLEFDCVIIPDCNEHIYPYGHNLNRLQVEEERRLFYVGITRAKKHLELLYLTDRKENSRQISRFLFGIKE